MKLVPKKKIGICLFILFLLLIFSSKVMAKESFSTGNNSENILNGGIIAYEDGKTYCSDQNVAQYLYLLEGDSKILLSKDSCSYINLSNEWIYYVANKNQINRIHREDGNKETLYTSPKDITDFYLVNDRELYFIVDGNIHSYSSGEDIVLREDGTISHIIPTSDGILYAKGSLFHWNLYVEGYEIVKDVTSFYEVDGYLYFTKDSQTKQANCKELFATSTPSKVVENYVDKEEEVTLSDVDTVALEEQGELLTAEEKEEEISLLATKTYTSALSSVSKGQQNIVKRAMQQYLIEWTPQKDIKGWGNNYTFKKGVTYSGLPYGQPVNASYVPWTTSLSNFVAYVNNSSSKMYTSTSTYNKVAPYYSNDCSAFVSWAWQTSSRKTTSTLSSVSTKVATQSIYSMEIGDALVYAGSHTVLVTDVGYDGSGNLAYIDITEQTPPQTKKTRYGAGGSYTLSQLTTKYLNSKYILYRSKTRTSVTYTHICEVPIDGDSCEKCATTTLSTTPTILGLSKSTAGITITWKKITGVEGYYIYRLIPGGSYQKIATLSDSKTSYTDTTVSNNQVYQYLVQGYKGNSTVDDSDIWIDAPTISKAEAKSTGTTLTWTSITGASKYYIYRGTTKLAETTKTSYTDTTATYGTTYSYSVSAVYSFKESEKSVSKSIKSVFIPTLTKPTLKSATIVSSGTTITWSKVTNSAGYYVYRRTPSGSFKKIASVTGTSYTDTTAVKTTAYYYTVQAYAGSVTSTKDETGILRKAKVTVSVSNLSNGIKISWPNVGSKITYKIFRRKSNSEKWGSTAYATTTSTSYTDTKATLTTSYQYGVKAYYGSKLVLDLTYSNYIQHKLVTPTIKTSVSGRKVTISWSKVTGAKGYQIQRKTKSGPWKTIKTTTSLQYTNSLSLAGSYYYRVRAYQVVSNKYYYSAYKTSSLLKIK